MALDRFNCVLIVANRQPGSKIAVCNARMERNSGGNWVQYSDAEKLRAERDDAIHDIATMCNTPTEHTYRNLYEGEVKKVDQRDREIADFRKEFLRLQREVDTACGEVSRWQSEFRRMAQSFAELNGWNYDMSAAPHGPELVELGCIYPVIAQWSITHEDWIYAGSGITRDGIVTLGRIVGNRHIWAWRLAHVPPQPDSI